MLLNEIIFKQERIEFTFSYNHPDVTDLLYQHFKFPCLMGLGKITCHPFFKVFRLANIDDVSGIIKVLIYTWFVGYCADQLFYRHIRQMCQAAKVVNDFRCNFLIETQVNILFGLPNF